MDFRHCLRALGANINMSNGTPIGGPQARVVDKTGLAGTYEFTLEFAGSTVSARNDAIRAGRG
jgi:uncharacterized protein (TIGR03435 family)